MPYPLARIAPNTLDATISKIERYSYRARRHFLWRWPKPRLSRFIYKYHSFSGPYSITNLRGTIVGSVLRMSSPTEFNDPLDMVAHFVMDGTEAARRERFEELIEKQSPHRGWRARQTGRILQRILGARTRCSRRLLLCRKYQKHIDVESLCGESHWRVSPA